MPHEQPLSLQVQFQGLDTHALRELELPADERSAGDVLCRLLEARTAEVERQNKELQLLAEVGRLLDRLPAEDVLQEAIERVCDLLCAAHGAIWLWDAQHGFRVVPHHLMRVWDMAFLNAGFGVCTDSDPVLCAFERREAVCVDDARLDPRFPLLRRYAHKLAFRGAIFVPLVHQDTPLAVISLHFDGPRQFAESELRLLETLGRQLAMAIRVAALGEALEASRDNLETRVAERTCELGSQKAIAETVVTSIPAAVAMLDDRGMVGSVNPGFERLTGQPAASLMGQPLRRAAPALARAIEPLLTETTTSGHPARAMSVQVAAGRRPGDMTHWDVTLVPVPDGMLLMAVDASDRHELARVQTQRIQDLQRVDQLKDEFLGILSHELRTPINTIMGFGSILEDGLAGPLTPTQQHYMQRILAGSEILLGLINDLLDMTRIRAGRFTIEPVETDFVRIARDVATVISPLAEKKSHQVKLRLPRAMPPLHADPQRISQAIMNLLSNAIKFTPEGGRIQLAAKFSARQLRFEVRDTGPGIAPEDQEKLFDKFVQLEHGRKDLRGSTGLGLAIAKTIVEAHGGTIGVESEPECGSTFWFTLPLAPRSASMPRAARRSAP